MSVSKISLNRTAYLRRASAGSTHIRALAFQVAAEMSRRPPASVAVVAALVLPTLLSLGTFRSELQVNFVSVDAELFRKTVEPFDVALCCVEVVFDCSDKLLVIGDRVFLFDDREGSVRFGLLEQPRQDFRPLLTALNGFLFVWRDVHKLRVTFCRLHVHFGPSFVACLEQRDPHLMSSPACSFCVALECESKPVRQGNPLEFVLVRRDLGTVEDFLEFCEEGVVANEIVRVDSEDCFVNCFGGRSACGARGTLGIRRVGLCQSSLHLVHLMVGINLVLSV